MRRLRAKRNTLGKRIKAIASLPGEPTTRNRSARTAEGIHKKIPVITDAVVLYNGERFHVAGSARATPSSHPPPTPTANEYRVSGARSRNSSRTGRFNEREYPKSPCARCAR